MPVGFKNGTDGGVQIAIDAMRAAAHPHRFLGVTEQGLAGIVSTRGNPDCHVILRGGATGPNYDAIHVQKTLAALRDAGLPPRVMIDASHGNSEKDYRRQPVVVREVAAQVAQGESGVIGMMMESFLVDGRQDLADPLARWSTARASPTRAWAGTRRCRCSRSWPPPCARAARPAASASRGARWAPPRPRACRGRAGGSACITHAGFVSSPIPQRGLEYGLSLVGGSLIPPR